MIAAAAGSAAFVLLHVRDPHVEGSYGFCPIRTITGQPCPGCGGLRAMNLLGRGEIVAAASSNLFAVSLVVVAAAAWLVWFVRRARGIPAPFLTWSVRSVAIATVAVVVFGVARLTPWGAWLAP